MKPFRFLPPVLAGLTACIALAGPETAPVAPPDEVDADPPEEEFDWSTGRGMAQAIRDRLDQLVPPGRAHEGLRYPVYEARPGAAPFRKSLFHASRMLRMDDGHLRFRDAVYAAFHDPENPETATRRVESADMVYDLVHDLIFSNVPIAIEDEKMSIHSGAMLHDRATGLTVFSGGVRLYLDEPATMPAAASAPDEEDPAPAPETP